MNKIIKWKTNTYAETTGYKFHCPRCDTKNTHAEILYKIEGQQIENLEETPPIGQEFIIIRCSTCFGPSIEIRTYKGYKIIITGTSSGQIESKKRKSDTDTSGGNWQFELDRTTIFPIAGTTASNVPTILQEDYSLMHLCHQIGSPQGVSVHCRRILESIFSEFESKYLTKEEKQRSGKIKERAKMIADKCVYFHGINDTLKSLQGVVSTIIHTPQDDLALFDDLRIDQKTFDDILQILDALLKVHDLEFKTIPELQSKHKKSKSARKQDT